MNMRLTPLKIAILYAVIGGLWILFSDTALMAVVKDPETFTRVAIIKGWGYVIVTALLLYWLIWRYAGERRIKELALEESEQYNRALFQRSVIGLALCHMDGALIDVNEAFARMIGRTVEETLKLTYWKITPEKYAEKEQEQLESLKTTGHYGPYEKEYIHKAGHLVPVRLQGLLIDHGGEQCIWSSVEDITERKQADDKLRRNEEVLRLFVEYSPAAIAMFDCDMKYIVASRRYLADYELGDQDLTGRHHYEVFPEMPDRWKEIHRRCLAGAIELCDEDPFPRSDGRLDWVKWEIRPWYATQGEIGGIILFSEVITERKKAENELNKLNAELEQRVKERTKELEDKIAEIERMNKLFVGRELRMVELKERIKDLEGQGARGKDET